MFSHVILADEINRTPPKTQAALLESMQERQVTVGRVRHKLTDPFFVLATQNPIEQEGTYPLPEAQQDRFMFKVFVKYPSFDEEFEIARRTTAVQADDIQAVLERRGHPRTAAYGPRGARHRSRDPLRPVAGPPDAPELSRHAGVRPGAAGLGSRPPRRAVPDPGWQGPGPAGRPRPRGDRGHQALARPVLRHRLVLNYAAESEGVTADKVVERLLSITPEKEDELTSDPRIRKIFAS